jgi:4-amino-4-deoxy-L-arabinose transferase-like glycosyltransferase
MERKINIINWIQSLSLTKILLFLILLQAAIHIKYSNYPPVGFHAWRQTIGLSVARNYYEEDMNLFTPRVDSRGQHTGITGMEFPLTNYLIAITYHIFGFNNISSRYLILAFSFVAIAFCFLFFKEMFKDKFYGLCAALLMIFSPLFCYYSFAVLPEVPSLAFLLISLFYLHKWDQENKNKYFTMFAIAFCLAGLIKISAIIILPYALILLIRKYGISNHR